MELLTSTTLFCIICCARFMQTGETNEFNIKLGHLPLTGKGRVGCSALSSPKNPLIFRIFDFGIFDFRFWHFRFSILTYRFWLHELVSGTLSYIICMRLKHLDMCVCLISVLNVTNFGFMENFDFCTFFFKFQSLWF